jgi:hypothetical protein
VNRPSRRISRVRNWKAEIRAAKDSAARLARAADYFRAMAMTVTRVKPAVAEKARRDATDYLIKAADDLARQVPADHLEKGWRATG